MIFFRKIRIDRWPEDYNILHPVDEIPADPITRDMNAAGNTFSLWEFTKEELIEGALTIALNNNSNKIDTMDIVFIDSKDLENEGLIIIDSIGNTIYKIYENKHHDIVKMNHKALGKVAKIIINSINNREYETIMRNDLLKALKQKIEYDEISEKNLNNSILQQISKHIQS